MPSPTILLAIALAVALAGDALLAKLYVGKIADLAAETQRYTSFVDGVKVVGEKQEKDTAAKIKEHKDAKEKADADHEKAVAALVVTVGELRKRADASSGGRIVPAAPAGARRVDLACFDRPLLESAIRGLVTEVRSIADEGAAATVDLDTARRWAADRISP